jgi:hypothetical protein
MAKSPRSKARAAGATVYTSPTPCKACDSHARYVSNGVCIECSRLKKRNRLEDPETAKADRAATRRRVAEYRARKRAEKEAAAFDDILG